VNRWVDRVNANPLPWLLDESTPAVRHLALRELMDLPNDHPKWSGSRRRNARRSHRVDPGRSNH